MTNIIKMPKRFDYSAGSEFNAAFSAITNSDIASKTIQLDCMQMDYIDSAGIGLLVMAHKKALNNRANISVINTRPMIKEILLLANLQKLISIK